MKMKNKFLQRFPPGLGDFLYLCSVNNKQLKTMDKKKIAKDIVEIIKNDIVENKKRRTKEFYTTSLNLYFYKDCFRFGVGGRNACTDKLAKYEMISVLNEVVSLLNALKKIKGWGLLNWNYTSYNVGEGYYTNYIDIPTEITLFSKPCKEFTSLANYINKYCGKKIELQDIYQVGIGGKRGRVYGEEGRREYLAYLPERCSMLLEQLRKNRGTKDIVTTTINQRDIIDGSDMRYSIEYETEFSGIRVNECKIEIKTPNGKVKKIITFA